MDTRNRFKASAITGPVFIAAKMPQRSTKGTKIDTKNEQAEEKITVEGIMATGTSEAKVTTDHKEIQKWVEERGGHPARVKGTERGESTGLLRIDYPGYSGEDRLEEITWGEFFEAFEENNLAFLYQEKTKDGKQSRFSKLVDRDKAEEE
jgi:hypothetical protein